ncbi:MAG: type II toxin-antitoxin system VapC family toxin [Candidatus Limnocylindrales bacterium]
MSRLSYLDASAIVKLVVDEVDSPGMLRWYVESDRIASSRIGLIEVRRATIRRPHDPAHLAHVLATIEVVEVDAQVMDRSSMVAPPELRTLDAIHLATAAELMPEIDAFVTYDLRLAAAARALGLPVVSPA